MALTPAQQQYYNIKKNYKDCILFFRMWDFYETFNEDAKICAKMLDIALTTKEKNKPNPTPMAGIPYHSVDKYIPKLLEHWYKIAIAEQVWEVKPGQIVERKVTQIITPWTYVRENKNNSYILSIVYEKWKYYIAWWDVSTGQFFTSVCADLEELKNSIFKIYPKEFVFSLNIHWKEEIEHYIKNFLSPYITHWEITQHAQDFLKQTLNISNFSSFWKALDNSWKAKALATLIEYLDSLNFFSALLKLSFVENNENIYLDSITIKNLEILQSSYQWTKLYSLLHIIDKTITPMWWRLLQNRIVSPTKNKKELITRQNWFEKFIQDNNLQQKTVSVLKKIYDIERICYLILKKKNNPFLWLKLKNSLKAVLELEKLQVVKVDKETILLYNQLEKAIEDWGFTEDKNYIKNWYSEKVDNLRELAYHSDKLLIDYHTLLTKHLNINSIKIRYINNMWYFVEVSKKDVEKFEKYSKQLVNDPDLQDKFDFVRKQTLKSVERYTSSYLTQIQTKVYNALEQLQQAEKQILEDFKNQLEQIQQNISNIAQQVAQIDIFCTLWKFFVDNNWTKPTFTDNKHIKIIWWRHPVIEKYLPLEEQFIPNDIVIQDDIVHIITWPNMWWKSTYLRQNALILLLAHCWFFVPATSCETYILDGIFARVWSGDIIAANQSTFMTEMIEVANILNNANQDSFIIFDELGRGTSTYDGLSISQAVIEYIIEKIKAKTLFATHYHELIKLEELFPEQVKNFSVAVYENNNNIVFLKKIIKWWISKSYWIHVAKLAWLPEEILKKAERLLLNFEEKKRKIVVEPLFSQPTNNIDPKIQKIADELQKLNPDNTTPIEALKILYRIKKELLQ